jgi:hypothetical protein
MKEKGEPYLRLEAEARHGGAVPRGRISCESRVDANVTLTNPTTASTTPWE